MKHKIISNNNFFNYILNLPKNNITIYKKYRFYNFAGEKYVPILNNWKSFSYEQYLEFIDHNETEKLRDIVNLRTSNPLEYYKRMIERENI